MTWTVAHQYEFEIVVRHRLVLFKKIEQQMDILAFFEPSRVQQKRLVHIERIAEALRISGDVLDSGTDDAGSRVLNVERGFGQCALSTRVEKKCRRRRAAIDTSERGAYTIRRAGMARWRSVR